MMLILTVIAICAVLMISEVWWRQRRPHSEFTRKFVHITVGSFVAFWPYFLTATDIMLLSLAFVVVTAISRYFNIFQAIHSVQRPTTGEFWFALVVGLLAIDLSHPHIFTAALLTMSLADGLAAVVGTRFGNGSRYAVFGAPKSIVGTATFFVVSSLILGAYCAATRSTINPALLIPSVSFVATILENVAVQGLDNLAIPLFVAGSLTFFS